MSRRTERVSDLIRDELSELLLREVRDPRLGGLISITRVEVTPDLYNARIFVSIMSPPDEQASAIRALNAAASFFHRELKQRIQMRRIPFLVFRLDTSIEEGARVLAQIDEVSRQDSDTLSDA
jgi:ribosome-binding factor A